MENDSDREEDLRRSRTDRNALRVKEGSSENGEN